MILTLSIACGIVLTGLSFVAVMVWIFGKRIKQLEQAQQKTRFELEAVAKHTYETNKGLNQATTTRKQRRNLNKPKKP